jgi:glycerate-2-kinase
VSAARAELEAIFRAGLRAVEPGAALRRAVEAEAGGVRIAGERVAAGTGCVVIAIGKAAPAMAESFEALARDLALRGVVVAGAGQRATVSRLECRTGGHPLPDASSVAAGRAVLDAAAAARRDEVLVVLLSGGASALTSAPLPGLSLDELRATTELLLRSGAEIGELNCVRKHLTAVSGGRLAAATPARRVFVLAVSDVLGDDLGTLGSGPCAPDASRYADALAVLEARGLRGRVPEAVRRHLEEGAAGRRPESLEPGDPALARVASAVIASNRDALAAAAAHARTLGLAAYPLSECLRGEAREIGARLAALARAVASRAPCVLLAGGEPTVTVRGAGRGGRAQELALAAALALAVERNVPRAGEARIALLAAGSDGRDGPTEAAGAFADGGSVARGRALGLDARACLDANDSHGFFAREGGALVTGPTGTNVMDLVLVHVAPAA